MGSETVLLLASLLALTPPPGPSAPVPGAKELFYDPVSRDTASVSSGVDTKGNRPTQHRPSHPRVVAPQLDASGRRRVSLPARSESREAPAVLGLSYWIELVGSGAGGGTQVTASRVFHSGERIRLHFRANAPGHIALIELGASGTARVLFPDLAAGLGDDRLPADEDRVLPGPQHWFRFDDHPGTERLLVLFAHDREDLDPLPARPQLGRQETVALLDRTRPLRGSKDLVIETESHTSSEIGTYGVNLRGKPVVLNITLEHR